MIRKHRALFAAVFISLFFGAVATRAASIDDSDDAFFSKGQQPRTSFPSVKERMDTAYCNSILSLPTDPKLKQTIALLRIQKDTLLRLMGVKEIPSQYDFSKLHPAIQKRIQRQLIETLGLSISLSQQFTNKALKRVGAVRVTDALYRSEIEFVTTWLIELFKLHLESRGIKFKLLPSAAYENLMDQSKGNKNAIRDGFIFSRSAVFESIELLPSDASPLNLKAKELADKGWKLRFNPREFVNNSFGMTILDEKVVLLSPLELLVQKPMGVVAHEQVHVNEYEKLNHGISSTFLGHDYLLEYSDQLGTAIDELLAHPVGIVEDWYEIKDLRLGFRIRGIAINNLQSSVVAGLNLIKQFNLTALKLFNYLNDPSRYQLIVLNKDQEKELSTFDGHGEGLIEVVLVDTKMKSYSQPIDLEPWHELGEPLISVFLSGHSNDDLGIVRKKFIERITKLYNFTRSAEKILRVLDEKAKEYSEGYPKNAQEFLAGGEKYERFYDRKINRLIESLNELLVQFR